jgi:AraC-like DNA-binding protein
MDHLQFTESIGRRFHRPPAPSVIACSSTRHPIVISHIRSETAMPGRTLPPPVEDAFAIHVHYIPLRDGETWLEGRHSRLPPVDKGSIFIFDLRTEPVAQLHEGFEFSRFHLTRATIDDLAYEQQMKRVGNFRSTPGQSDPVVFHLAQALAQRIEILGKDQDSFFEDGIALAFFAHVARAYGGALPGRIDIGCLAPWQVRRISDWVDANMHAPMSIGDIAGVLGLSPSYFARAFLKTTGLPPHRWLLQRKLLRAKQLLRGTSLPLTEISSTCGFADQSHFTRVFGRTERLTPARWRRVHR